MSRLAVHVDLFSREAASWQGDAIIVALYEGGLPQDALSLLGEAVTAEVRRALDQGWVRGKGEEMVTLPIPPGSLGAARLVLAGLGKREKLTAESFRMLGGRITDYCHRTGIAAALVLPSLEKYKGVKGVDLLEALAEGIWLADYRFDHYRNDKEELPPRNLKQVALAVKEKSIPRYQGVLNRVAPVVNAVYLARDMANHPANHMTPEEIASIAQELAHALPIQVTVLDEKKLAEKGMNALLGVGQGSMHPPRLIVLEYRGAHEKPPLVVVGKAVTFDSGGLSLKPAARMHEMKYDMCGGAAVIGFLQAVAAMKLPVNVVGIIPAAENMPSGTAQRPGDIVRTAKGLYVEIQNTDAEGRLILCDALHYAERFDPHTIIDLATLTGACVVALGNHASGLFSNDKCLSEALVEAGRHTGERLWPLPMFDDYQSALKTPLADLRNIGDGNAGAIIGACFLSRFIGEKRRWAHLDIAGTAWDLEGKRSYVPKGGVGLGIRLLCRFVRESLS